MLLIFSLFKCANSLFAETVFIHYVINSFVMCTLTLLLSRSSFDISLIVNAFYFVLKCVQQFGQCASAHQVTLEVILCIKLNFFILLFQFYFQNNFICINDFFLIIFLIENLRQRFREIHTIFT